LRYIVAWIKYGENPGKKFYFSRLSSRLNPEALSPPVGADRGLPEQIPNLALQSGQSTLCPYVNFFAPIYPPSRRGRPWSARADSKSRATFWAENERNL